MPDFKDTFNRPNAADLGNGWKYKHKTEGTEARKWRVVNNKAAPVVDGDISTIAYRPSPVPLEGIYKVVWKHRALPGVNSAECVFRYSATGGQNNRRWAIVLTGATGSVQRRQGTTNVQVGSWSRVDDSEFDIELHVAGDVITVYDTNFTGVDNKAFTITDGTWKDATGIGMGSGVIDEFEIDDIEGYSSSEFEFAPVTVKLDVGLQGGVLDPEATSEYPDAQQSYAGVRVDPYTVIDGIPTARVEAVVPVLCEVTDDATSNTLLPLPSSINLGSDFRFLPETYSNGVQWADYQSRNGKVWTVNTQPSGDPVKIAGYRYSCAYGLVTRDVVSFNEKGFMQLSATTESAAKKSRTIAVCAVLHSGSGPSYGIFSTDRSKFADQTGAALNLRYRHGRFELRAGLDVVSHEGHRRSTRPSIVVVSVDATTDRGLLVIQDSERASRSFALRGIDSFAQGMFFGAAMNQYDEFNASVASDMDVLEIDLWDRALSEQEIDRLIHRLSAIYGVAL